MEECYIPWSCKPTGISQCRLTHSTHPVVLATCTTPLSGIITHPSMYKVPIRWYNLVLLCIGWIPAPDFGVLGMRSSHWKVVKGVIQPRTWENGYLGGRGVCDLVHTQKDELSQSKHMGMTIYTKGNINLANFGQDHADVGAKGKKPVYGPK